MSLESLNENMPVLSSKELKLVTHAVSSLLTMAVEEKRVTCGLRPAITALDKASNEILFCVMPQTRDSGKHIHSVLLQAFCYEHNITIIKVDNINSLRAIVGATDCSCILIHKNIGNILWLELELEKILLSAEKKVITLPVLKLPVK